MVKILYDRARAICTKEDLLDEKCLVGRNILAYGYPEKFIEVHNTLKQRKIDVPKAKRRKQY